MRHRPEYITASAPYVRPAVYVPPPTPRTRPAAADTIRSANPIWSALAVAVAVVFFLSAFAYGVNAIASADPGTQSSTWVTPTTYGPPPAVRR